MSLLFLDSFDHYTDLDEKWDSQFLGSNIFATQSEGRFTPGALQVKGSGGGGRRDKNLPNSTELIAGFGWINFNGDTHNGLFGFVADDGSASLLSIDTDTGIATFDWNGNTATTASGVFTGSVWQHVEIRCVLSDTVGILEIRRGGAVVASLTGIDTLPVGVTTLSGFRVSASDNAQLHYVDDLYILNGDGTENNTYIGDSRITVLRPQADSTVNNFTVTGAASNWDAVNDTLHDGDTSYVEAGVVGSREAYDNLDFTDLAITPGTIYGVQTTNAVKKTDAGRLDYKDNMQIAGLVYDNGIDVVSTSGIYKMTTMIRDTDPSDDATWTEAKVAAVGSGIIITFREE